MENDNRRMIRLEHRRRRTQSVQPVEERQDTAQENVQENAAADPAQDMHTEAAESAPRRRRRAQAAQDLMAVETAAPIRAEQANAGRIPQLPHEDVRVEDEAQQQEKRRQPAAAAQKETPREKKTYTSRIPHSELKAARRRAEEKMKRTGSAVLRHGKPALDQLGSLLMALGMLIGEGVSKLADLASALRGKLSSPIREEGHAPQPAEAIELEAIRPEAYHGSAQHRNDRQAASSDRRGGFAPGRVTRKRGGKAMRFDVQQLLSLVFAGVAIVSAFMIVSILWRTVRTNATNKKVAELYAQSADYTPEPQTTPEFVVFMPEDEAAEDGEMTIGGEIMAYGDAQEQAAEAGEGLTLEGDTQESDALSDADAAQTQGEAAKDAVAAAEPTIAPMGKRIYHHVGGDALPQMAALHKENRDIVGWLKIENVLDLPVVYRDNSYYLKRDFYKQKNTAGTIFLDENHPFKAKTQNLLLHGHNMKDGTMFGRLLQYETDLNYVRWHPFVRFDTLWRKEEYVIFAVLRVSLDVRSEDFFNYFSYPTFVSDEQFMSYIRQLQLRSIYAIPVDVKPTDALLTMSTCLEEDRLVIVARRVREGETHTQLRQVTNLTTRQ